VRCGFSSRVRSLDSFWAPPSPGHHQAGGAEALHRRTVGSRGKNEDNAARALFWHGGIILRVRADGAAWRPGYSFSGGRPASLLAAQPGAAKGVGVVRPQTLLGTGALQAVVCTIRRSKLSIQGAGFRRATGDSKSSVQSLSARRAHRPAGTRRTMVRMRPARAFSDLPVDRPLFFPTARRGTRYGRGRSLH